MGNRLVVLFLKHIRYLLMGMVLYVNHGGLQTDLKGGSGGGGSPPGEKKFKLIFSRLNSARVSSYLYVFTYLCIKRYSQTALCGRGSDGLV